MDRGHRDRGSLDLAVRSDELLDRTKTAAAELARNCISPRGIRIHDSDEPYRNALVAKLVVNAGVIAAKRAYADYGDVNGVAGCQFAVLSWPVAGRPVDLITKNRQIGHQVKRNDIGEFRNRITASALFSVMRSDPRGRARAARFH